MINSDNNMHYSHLISHIYVQSLNSSSSLGRLHAGNITIPCLLGKNGLSYSKKEGDGTTPRGQYKIGQFYIRPENRLRMRSHHQLKVICQDLKWCDNPSHPLYNRPTSQNITGSYERLWRNDKRYDVIGIIDYNFTYRVNGRGSAIFFHLAENGSKYTEGCVAITANDMRRLLPRLSSKLIIHIGQR
jgi:L,D-peptidoglycan transpeptidase YkuD (ErfK/YbiS/YcfS/YnhG family)